MSKDDTKEQIIPPPSENGHKEKIEIEMPKAGVDEKGYIWLRIHASHGILFVVGFIYEKFLPWLRLQYAEMAKPKKPDIINPYKKGGNPFRS